jgi:hypothetical protein
MPMTEAEWLACADPRRMIRLLPDTASDRKLRLFAVASCRYCWGLLPDERSRTAVEVAERFADGNATMTELDDAETAAGLVIRYDAERYLVSYDPTVHLAFAARDAADEDAFFAAKAAADNLSAEQSAYPIAANVYPETPFNATAREQIRCWLLNIIHDLLGDPFRPSTPLPPAVLAWNDRTIPRLAEAIYEDRKMPEGTLDNARLAILADALLDAGCGDEDLIQHCREPGPHARGCWAVDLILGKE